MANQEDLTSKVIKLFNAEIISETKKQIPRKMAKEKIYVGKAKVFTFPDGGTILKVNLNLNSLRNKVDLSDTENAYINFDVTKMKQKDDYGNEYTVTLNPYKLKMLEAEVDPNDESIREAPADDSNDLPF